MNNSFIVRENHIRTSTKAIVYRILHMSWVFILAQLFGGTAGQSGTLVLAATLVGTISYYLYDRFWAWLQWGHSNNGRDIRFRTILKTVGYRILMIIAATFVVMIIMDFSLLRAASLAVSDFISAMILYYALERFFNFFDLGRKLEPAK